MSYDITTIGSLVTGTCACGGRKGLRDLEPAQIAGLVDSLNEFGEKLTIQYWAKRGAEKIGKKIDAAIEAAEETAGRVLDPLPIAIDMIGVPTWGFDLPVYAKGAAIVGAVVGVGYLGYKMTKKGPVGKPGALVKRGSGKRSRR
jgi:hypothetical protein